MAEPTQKEQIANYGERLVAVETKLDIVISNQQAMSNKLDILLPTLVTGKILDEKIKEVRSEIAEAKKIGKIRAFYYSLASAIITAVFVFEVMRFLKGDK
jgi:hypothetical protein